MIVNTHLHPNATHFIDTAGPLPPSDDRDVPPCTAPNITIWPPGGTADHPGALEQLIYEINDVFGFVRSDNR